MSFCVISAMIPIKLKATIKDSIKMVELCTIVLKIFGVFIRYIKIRLSITITIANTMINTILSFKLTRYSSYELNTTFSITLRYIPLFWLCDHGISSFGTSKLKNLRANSKKNKNSIIRTALLNIITIVNEPAISNNRILIVMKMLTKIGI